MSIAGSVLRVGSVTANFQSETPLHPSARAFLGDAFDRGWADPSKPHQSSRQTAILLNESKEIFSRHLGIRSDQVEFLADPALGFHLGLTGLASSGSQLFYSAVDRSEVFAVADGTPSTKLSVGLNGLTEYPEGSSADLLAWQAANGETGITSIQPTAFKGRIFVDATTSGPHVGLPDSWDAALWNSQSWQGPRGLGIFALSARSRWRNPLPHIDQNISSSNYSIPLAIASALALEGYVSDFQMERKRIASHNARIREFLLSQIRDVDIAGSVENGLPYLLSFSILYIDAQILINQLDQRGFAIDSGSACSSANMEPSHVLAAMGILTHGNVRLTLHPELKDEQVEDFLRVLKEITDELRD